MAYSFLVRHGYVKRKGTRTARKVPNDFEIIKSAYLENIKAVSQCHQIPPSMAINLDQTGVKIIPVSDWTLEVQGSKQVDLVALDDKREITGLLPITLSGKLLSPQIIYKGTTHRCHPNVAIPTRWHVTHSQNHWSILDTMLEYVDEILCPYMTEQRKLLNLESDATGLCIFDVFACHRCPQFLKKLHDCGIKHVFVPAGCTGLLQPLDISVRSALTEVMLWKTFVLT